MAFPLSSICSDEYLEAAQQVVDRLLAQGAWLDGEEMYPDVLSDLVGVYEDEHHSSEPAEGYVAEPAEGSAAASYVWRFG